MEPQTEDEAASGEDNSELHLLDRRLRLARRAAGAVTTVLVVYGVAIVLTAHPEPCSPGTWDHDQDSATDCIVCEAGNYTTVDVVEPELSWLPDWLPLIEHNNFNDYKCNSLCALGSYAPAGSDSISSCEACQAGQSDHDSDPSTLCVDCPSGRYSPANGTVGDCDGACNIGSFGTAGSHSNSSCEACQAGQSDHDSDPSTLCVDCTSGRYSPANGTVGDCDGECNIGSFGTSTANGGQYSLHHVFDTTF
eukprot:COSAG05_NODE_129_length_17200_cov_47.810128_6_plen_250_part_00